MSNWECGVCGYNHKEEELPEKCPICEAPQKMFTEKVEDQPVKEDPPVKEDQSVEEKGVSDEEATGEIKQWRCKISGYLHTGPTPPEKCPICEGLAEDFEEVKEEVKEVPDTVVTAVKRWRCTICGYIYNGDEPPEKCPICDAPRKMFVEIDAEGNVISELETDEADADTVAAEIVGKQSISLLDKIGELILKFHLHPITVHFPNGVLPVVLVFLGLSVYFKIISLEVAAWYNLIFVLAMLPAVLLTGYVEWQKRYKGIKTTIFIVKIICSVIVLGAVNVLVFWRLLDPAVATDGSPYQLIYLGIGGAMVGAVALAGHLGGKLVHAARG